MTKITGWDLPKTIAGIPKMNISNADEIGGGGGDLKARTNINNLLTSTHLKCDTNGILETSINRLQGLTDIDDITTKKNVRVETSGAIKVNNEEMNIGNDTSISGSRQQVLTYSKDLVSGNLKALTCDTNGNLNTALPSVAPIDGTQSLPAVQIGGYDSNGLDFKALQVNNNRALETSDEKITKGEGDITGGGDGLQQVLMYGKDQSGNLDPINVDNNGHLKITLNDIEANITNAIKTQILGIDGSTQRQVKVDSTGQLLISQATFIERGSIVFPAPFGSGAVSNVVDIENKKTLSFHIEGMTNTHTGFIVQGSNNNSTFYSLEMFYPQTVGITDYIGGSITKGFRYYRIENAGSSVSITASPYQAYE